MDILDFIAQDWYIVYNKTLAKSIGVNQTIIFMFMVSQYKFFANNNTLTDDGYFYKTADDIYEATGLSRYQQKQAIDDLQNRWLIAYKPKGVPAKLHFKLFQDKFSTLFNTSIEETWKLDLKKVENIYIDNNNINNKIINKNNNNVFDLKIWFDLFWDAYPRHTAKPVAQKAYNKIILATKDQQAMHDKIMQGVQYLVDDIKAQIIKKDFIPHASTWLNQDRWQDEYRWPLYIKHHKHINKPTKTFTPITMDDDNNNPNPNTSSDGTTNERSVIKEHASTTRSSWSGLWSIFGEMQRTEAEFDTEHQHL